MVRKVLAVLLLVTAGLSGCLGSDSHGADQALGPAAQDGDGVEARARVVVADIDTGINPYHVEFRDTSDEAYQHPSTYLDGYPENATALNITLDAADYEAAVRADCELWKGVEQDQLYWFPGTRIIGARTTSDLDVSCDEDAELPGLILDRGGHGTMTASRVVGDTSSLCPDCKLVAIQGFTVENMAWAADHPWIDLQTNSWGHLPDGFALREDDRETVRQAAAKQPIFVAGGNGLLGFFGVTGHPAYLDNVAGPQGIVMVGGHDGGHMAPWPMHMPHVVADAMMHPAADHESLDEIPEDEGGGTSGATPFAAGAFARMILEARRTVDDHDVGIRDGNLVWGKNGTPTPETGPLEDGFLSVEEAKTVFFHTANPRPVKDGRYDGPSCDPTSPTVRCTLYPTTPVPWGTIPEDAPAYYFVGYGQVGNLTLADHIAAVTGEMPVPERPQADAFYGFDQQARGASDEAAGGPGP